MTTNLARLLTASDAARVLNVGVSTVIRWINNGEILPVGKLAGPRGTWLIAESEVYDLAALHHAYGINPNYHSGDDTYGFKPFNKDAVGNDIYIHDGGGQDTFDASEQTLDINIDLTEARHGECYDNRHNDRYAPAIAHNFTELLALLYHRQGDIWYWLYKTYRPNGDPHDMPLI